MRVSLARALVTEPNLLLLDEPFAALDDLLRQQLNEDLLADLARRKWTGVFVTHNVAEAVYLSQRVLIMGPRPGTHGRRSPGPLSPIPVRRTCGPNRSSPGSAGRSAGGCGRPANDPRLTKSGGWADPAPAAVFRPGGRRLATAGHLVAGCRCTCCPVPGGSSGPGLANARRSSRRPLLTAAAAVLRFPGQPAGRHRPSRSCSPSRAAIRRSCYPYAIFLQTVPIVAIAPLIITWFDYGFHSVVLVARSSACFRSSPTRRPGCWRWIPLGLELFQLHNATRWQLLFKLRLPNAVPYLVAGAKTSSGLSVVGAIVGEFFVGPGMGRLGLGYLIRQKLELLKTAELFAAVIASAVLGVADLRRGQPGRRHRLVPLVQSRRRLAAQRQFVAQTTVSSPRRGKDSFSKNEKPCQGKTVFPRKTNLLTPGPSLLPQHASCWRAAFTMPLPSPHRRRRPLNRPRPAGGRTAAELVSRGRTWGLLRSRHPRLF